MANSHKDIVIAPATDSVNDPTITFTGFDNNSPIRIRVQPDGSLSFEGTQGQLFGISDTMSGTLFAASDISGIAGISLDSLGLVQLNPVYGRTVIGQDSVSSVGIGDSDDKAQINGDVTIYGKLKVDSGIVTAENAPSTSSAAGDQHEIRVDNDYIYVKTATQWKRVALDSSTF